MKRFGEGIDGRWGWILVLLVSAYVVYATIDWQIPAPGGASFGPVWAALTIGLAIAMRVVRGVLTPALVLAAVAVSGMALTDVTLFWSQGLRDFHLYLKAGEHFLDGSPVYLTGLFTVRPADLTNFPFLYPPLVVPVFAALSVLPRLAVDVAWVALSAGLAVAGLRAIGLPLRWAIAALLWPPFAQGLYVGNVAVPIFALFAAAPWLGSGLPLSSVFKAYDAIVSLWLVRERRWGALGIGLAILVLLVIATLPLTGIGLWADWIAGLDWYARSQPLLPGSLYGIGLARYVPQLLGIALGFGAVLVALRVSGLDGLARLGTATVIASPSLFSHGFLLAIPSMLRLRPVAFWTAVGLLSVAPGLGWWMGVAVVVAGWWLPGLRLDGMTPAADLGLHPLGSDPRIWRNAPDVPADERAARAARERLSAPKKDPATT